MANTKVTSAVIADGAITPSKIASGDFYFDTNTLYIDATNNTVGIGNTVSGTINSQSGYADLVVGTGSGENGATIYSGSNGVLAFADGTSGTSTYEGFMIYAHGDNSMRFGTSSTEKVRIDSSGNLLSGTSTSKGSRLQVASAGVSAPTLGSSTNTGLLITNSDVTYGMNFGTINSGDGWIQQHSNTGTATAYNLLLQPVGGNVGIGTSSVGAKLEVYGTADSSPQTSGGIFKINSTATNAICFGTLNSSPFGSYIQSGGSGVYPLVLNPNGAAVTVGTTSTSALKMHIKDDTASTTSIMIVENVTSAVSANSVLLDLKFSGDDSFSNCDYIKFQDSSGEEGVITGDGGGRVYYEITSDYRKKENIVDYTGGLNVVNNLSVKNYNMITNPNITYTGFIAHEVQEVVDGVARGTKDAIDDEGNPIYQGLDLSKLVPHLVSAIQEQQTIIDDLKARIETLENA